jgi:hypothetical protein
MFAFIYAVMVFGGIFVSIGAISLLYIFLTEVQGCDRWIYQDPRRQAGDWEKAFAAKAVYPKHELACYPIGYSTAYFQNGRDFVLPCDTCRSTVGLTVDILFCKLNGWVSRDAKQFGKFYGV